MAPLEQAKVGLGLGAINMNFRNRLHWHDAVAAPRTGCQSARNKFPKMLHCGPWPLPL